MIEYSNTDVNIKTIVNEQTGNIATIVEVIQVDSGDVLALSYYERIKTGIIRAGRGTQGSYWAEYEVDNLTTIAAVEIEHACLDDALSALERSIEQTNDDLRSNPLSTGVPVEWTHDPINV